MDSSTHNETAPQKTIAPEFGSWPMSETQVQLANHIRGLFDKLQSDVTAATAPHNQRYLAIVKTKLEEACMFAVKGIAKPN